MTANSGDNRETGETRQGEQGDSGQGLGWKEKDRDVLRFVVCVALCSTIFYCLPVLLLWIPT